MATVTRELGSRLLSTMKLMRELEHRIENLYRQGKIVGGVFIGRGQEAISAGSAIQTLPEDVVCPSRFSPSRPATLDGRCQLPGPKGRPDTGS